jgi:hypothetical protein
VLSANVSGARGRVPPTRVPFHCAIATRRSPAPAALLRFTAEGFAISDLLTELGRLLGAMALPADVRVLLLEKLADIE